MDLICRKAQSSHMPACHGGSKPSAVHAAPLQGLVDLNALKPKAICLNALKPKALMPQGLVDLIYRKAYTFEGPNGDEVTEGPLPADMIELVDQFRAKLVEAVRGVT